MEKTVEKDARILSQVESGTARRTIETVKDVNKII